MSDQLRTLAEAKSQIAFPVPELHMLKEIRKERRIGYVEGFIAGRTSVTREQIVDVLVMSPLSDYAGTEMGPINRTADAILALLNGGTDD